MSEAAASNVQETGTDVTADIARIGAGNVSRDDLLVECLSGSDADREQGWRDSRV